MSAPEGHCRDAAVRCGTCADCQRAERIEALRGESPISARDQRGSTLTDFLLARIAEDEAAPPGFAPSTRVLAECEAKRRIVEGWDAFLSGAPRWAEAEVPSLLAMARTTLALLALPYADHPDYREEWKPGQS